MSETDEIICQLERAKSIIKLLYGIISTLIIALFFAIGWIYTQRLDIMDNQRRLNNVESNINSIRITLDNLQ